MKWLLLLSAFFYQTIYGQYSLELNLQKDNIYHLKINSSNQFSGEMEGHSVKGSYTIRGSMHFKVVEASAAGYQLDVAYDSIDIQMKGPMGKFEFNSADIDQAGSGYGNISEKQVRITLLKNGAISKIENKDTSGFMVRIKGNPMFAMLKQMMMMGGFKQSMGSKAMKDAMKENIEKITALYPDHKVKINESWVNEIRPDSAHTNWIKTTYQLISYQDGIARIKGHTETGASSSDKQPKSMFGTVIGMSGFNITGQSESLIEINTNTGWIREASVKNDFKGNLKMSGKQSPNQPESHLLQLNGDTNISGF
jgi:hypothetical protein